MQVQGAISAIKYTEQFPQLPAVFDNSGQRDMDMFDLLEYVFGFQVGVNVVLRCLISNLPGKTFKMNL